MVLSLTIYTVVFMLIHIVVQTLTNLIMMDIMNFLSIFIKILYLKLLAILPRKTSLCKRNTRKPKILIYA